MPGLRLKFQFRYNKLSPILEDVSLYILLIRKPYKEKRRQGIFVAWWNFEAAGPARHGFSEAGQCHHRY